VNDCIHETHPELAFRQLNGERPLDVPKKVKGRPHAAGLRYAAGYLRMSDFLPQSSKQPRPVALAQTICSTRSRAHGSRDASH
jgi:predicted RNase H-like nuclease